MLQFEALEETCLTYLHAKLSKLNAEGALCLMKLGDHIGNPKLVEHAAETLVKRRWRDNQKPLIALIKDLHCTDLPQLKKLLHHADRGAVTELGVLELSEYAKLPEDTIAAMIDLEVMQAVEIDVLLGILANSSHTGHHDLLRRAVHRQVKCRQTQHEEVFTDNRRFVSNVMVPDRDFPNLEPYFQIDLPQCQLHCSVQVLEQTGMQSETHVAMYFFRCIFQCIAPLRAVYQFEVTCQRKRKREHC